MSRAELIQQMAATLGSPRASRAELREALKAAYAHLAGNRAGRPAVVTEAVVRQIEGILQADPRTTIDTLAATCGISRSAAGKVAKAVRDRRR